MSKLKKHGFLFINTIPKKNAKDFVKNSVSHMHTYAPMDGKKSMMNADVDNIMLNRCLNEAKSPTSSVSLTQLYDNKQLIF